MKKIFLLLTLTFILTSCKKQDEWLDKKSNKADLVPQTIQDLQALLDNESIINYNYPTLTVISSDNFYNEDDIALNGGNSPERNAYKWLPVIFDGPTSIAGNDWTVPYRTVSYCNVALSGLKAIDITTANQSDYNNVKGNALFHRSLAFYNMLQVFSKPYDKNTATTDLGIPLKLDQDVNEKVSRQSVQQCYDQILSDLSLAESLLPSQPLFKTRAGKVTVFALLARIYLTMGDYQSALKYAKQALAINSSLLNFNAINTTPSYPFPTYQTGNTEIIFYAISTSFAAISIANLIVEDALYNQYGARDLRKTLFFGSNANGTKTFRGRYTGISSLFAGLATNELYLIKAECEARTGNISDSMATLNGLLTTRWTTGFYVPYTAASENEALTIILAERNKELPFTANIRWCDLRRLNKDQRFAKTLTRTVAGQIYRLPPNDPRYVLPIPDTEVSITGLVQNPR